MVFPADTFQEATEIAIEASNQLHGVINGDANAEVTVEDGSKIPSVRKAMVDSLYFKPPIAWAQGEYEDTYNQLREFVDGDVRTWWFAKGATVSTPVLMSTNPATDINWTLWGAVTINAATYETQKRLAAEAGLNMVGSFLLGATVTSADDVVFYETDGKYYGWGGTLPRVVPAGSTPATSGGVGALLWVDRTDVLLRSELSSPTGAVLVNNGGESVSAQINRLLKSNLGVFHVDNYGAVGDGAITSIGTSGNVITGTSDTAAIQSAINAAEAAGGGIIRFTPYKSYRVTYTLLFGSNLIFDFQNARVIWDCPSTTPEASFLLGKHYNMGDDINYSENIIIRDLRLVTYYLRGNGIGLPKCRNVLVDNIRTEYCYLHTVDATGTKNCVMQRIYVDCASTLAHLQVDVATGQTSVSGADSLGNYLYCAYDATGTALWAYADNCFLRYCYVTNNLYAGIHVHNRGARRVYIDNCYIAANLRGIHTDDGGYVLSLWITNNTIRNNDTYELYLQADHREIYIHNNVIGNDSRVSGGTLELVTMRSNASNLTQRISASFIGNKFSGRYRGTSLQYLQNVVYKDNEHRAMGDALTSSAITDATSYGVNLFNCNNVISDGNMFYGCIVDACMAHNVGSHLVSANNKAQGSGSLLKLTAIVNGQVSGNQEAPLASVLVGSLFDACTRITVAGHHSLLDGAVSALYVNAGTLVYLNNCTVGSSTASGVGVTFASGSTSGRTSCNNIRTVTNAIVTTGATSITCHEPFIPAANIINSGTGTITYNTFTTSTK